MVHYQGERESVHVYTGEETLDHRLREEDIQRKEWTYVNEVVEAINVLDKRRARRALRSYETHYPSSNIFTKSQRDHIVSELENAIDSIVSDEPVSVGITSKVTKRKLGKGVKINWGVELTPYESTVASSPKPN